MVGIPEGPASVAWDYDGESDVLGVPVQTLVFPEAAVIGDAMIAFAGIGAFRSLDEAAANMVHPAGLFEPDPDMLRVYESAYAQYSDLLERLYPRS